MSAGYAVVRVGLRSSAQRTVLSRPLSGLWAAQTSGHRSTEGKASLRVSRVSTPGSTLTGVGKACGDCTLLVPCAPTWTGRRDGLVPCRSDRPGRTARRRGRRPRWSGGRGGSAAASPGDLVFRAWSSGDSFHNCLTGAGYPTTTGDGILIPGLELPQRPVRASEGGCPGIAPPWDAAVQSVPADTPGATSIFRRRAPAPGTKKGAALRQRLRSCERSAWRVRARSLARWPRPSAECGRPPVAG
jgi:hypothetical protein